MMLPPRFAAYMRFRHALVVRKAPSRWIASSFRHSSNSSCSTALTTWMPAFDTRIRPPRRLSGLRDGPFDLRFARHIDADGDSGAAISVMARAAARAPAR